VVFAAVEQGQTGVNGTFNDERRRTALILGASRGLGLGLTDELYRRGWHVTGTARDLAKADALRDLAAASDGRVQTQGVDINDAPQIEGLVGHLADRRFDLLFINAGIMGAEGPIAQLSDAELLEVLHTNALSPIRVAQRLLPQVNEGGKLAFMSSLMGSISANEGGGSDLYRISKAALNMLTRSLVATALGQRNITVLTLHPGWVRTDMGGSAAPLAVRESVTGLADVLERQYPERHLFMDYRGRRLPW
jgi:NAD(P)-dependent dehydrogenase (short-subunit alcohol dehydrogenase family)